MDLVEETIKAYSASVDDFVAKHSDINVIKNEADFFISNIKGKKILDVGCGIGRDAKYFSEQGYSITGIDLTPEFIDIAKKNVPSGHFYIADMRKMIFMDDYFDGIWSMASILHIPKKEANKTLEEHSRILKSKGIMFLSTMEGKGESPLPASLKYGGHSKFFYCYQEDELKELLESSGFSIEKFERDEKPERKITFFNVLAKKN